MPETIINHTYSLKGGEQDAVERANPFLRRREPIVVYCRDGKTRMKIGDGVHNYNDLDWMGDSGDSTKEVYNFRTRQNFPNVGSPDIIYKAENEAKLYQWNSTKLIYEPLDNVDVNIDIGDIEVISGGQASDLIKT